MIEIYTTDTCTYCEEAKEFFRANNVKYVEYNVKEDEARKKEMVKLTGKKSVPVIKFADGDFMVGFDEDVFVGFLMNRKKMGM